MPAESDGSVTRIDALMRDCFADEGTSWYSEVRNATQVVLFGSRAANVAGDGSDWDILCVGNGSTRLGRRLDIVWVREEDVQSANWLGSELASHIGAYGVWLVGEDDWTGLVSISNEAVSRKEQRVRRQLQGLEKYYDRILPSLRAKHLRRVRRQVQRLQHLRRNRPVPPSPLLDEIWASHESDGHSFASVLCDLSVACPRQLATLFYRLELEG